MKGPRAWSGCADEKEYLGLPLGVASWQTTAVEEEEQCEWNMSGTAWLYARGSTREERRVSAACKKRSKKAEI